jgi:hypothetical protein
MQTMRRLLILSLAAVALPAFAAPVVLERVETVPGPTPGVRLTLSAPVTPLAHSLRAPERITLDLPGTVLGPAVRQPTAGAGSLTRVRTGQLDGGIARVVLDLTERAPFTVSAEGRVVTIMLSAASPPPPPEAPAAAPASAPAPKPAANLTPTEAPALAASTTSLAPDGDGADVHPSGTHGLFLDYTDLLFDPDAPVLRQPERQPHLHVGQPQQ